jgi:hypothetical protein
MRVTRELLAPPRLADAAHDRTGEPAGEPFRAALRTADDDTARDAARHTARDAARHTARDTARDHADDTMAPAAAQAAYLAREVATHGGQARHRARTPSEASRLLRAASSADSSETAVAIATAIGAPAPSMIDATGGALGADAAHRIGTTGAATAIDAMRLAGVAMTDAAPAVDHAAPAAPAAPIETAPGALTVAVPAAPTLAGPAAPTFGTADAHAAPHTGVHATDAAAVDEISDALRGIAPAAVSPATSATALGSAAVAALTPLEQAVRDLVTQLADPGPAHGRSSRHAVDDAGAELAAFAGFGAQPPLAAHDAPAARAAGHAAAASPVQLPEPPADPSHVHLVIDDGPERVVATVAVRGSEVHVALRSSDDATAAALARNAASLDHAMRSRGLDLQDLTAEREPRDRRPSQDAEPRERRARDAERFQLEEKP